MSKAPKKTAKKPSKKASALYALVHEMRQQRIVMLHLLTVARETNQSLVRQRADIDKVYVGQKILGDRLDAVRAALEAVRVDNGTVFKALEAVRIGQGALDDAIATFITNPVVLLDPDLAEAIREVATERQRARGEG